MSARFHYSLLLPLSLPFALALALALATRHPQSINSFLGFLSPSSCFRIPFQLFSNRPNRRHLLLFTNRSLSVIIFLI
jgi:hypothetical protein